MALIPRRGRTGDAQTARAVVVEFYESDATFENFVIRALASIPQQSIDSVKQVPPLDREQWLLHCLDQSLHLIVLDGWSGQCWRAGAMFCRGWMTTNWTK